MTTLHVLHDSHWPAALDRLWQPGDTLLLTGAAVTLACRRDLSLPSPTMALADSVSARGLEGCWPAGVARIDMSAWVELVCRHSRSVAWS